MRSRRGYTLVEVLAVLAVIGIAIALAQVRLAPSPAQVLDDEARRVALLLEAARDEAMMQSCTVAWIARADSHQIGCRRGGAGYPSHAWSHGVALERMWIAGVPVPRESPLLFTPSGINTPFELVIAMKGNRVHVSGDALGRVTVSK
jgi:general secretion pathway protein H